MSETATNEATAREGTCYAWHCETCGHDLAVVTDGEAWFEGQVRLNGRRALALCPACGHWNVWMVAGGRGRRGGSG